ncbi:MAG: YbjN domain-containing protein [Bacilli bacterium]|nr:YbjN domain-containing protein [Bacilli bacterium]
MADNLKKSALENYKLICNALDEIEFDYETDEENLKVRFGYITEDEERLHFVFSIKQNQQLITLYIYPEYDVKKEKTLDIAIATSVINYALIDGSFDFDTESCDLMFRMTTNFWDSLLSTEVVKQMIFAGAAITEQDFKILSEINDGSQSLKEFLENY